MVLNVNQHHIVVYNDEVKTSEAGINQENQKRANQMMENEKKAKEEYTAKRIKEYVEFKMLKGHSEEEATKMAKEQIMNQAP